MQILVLLVIVLISGSRKLETFAEDSNTRYPKPVIFDAHHNLSDLEDVPEVCEEYESEGCAKAWLHEFDIIQRRNSNRVSNAKYSYLININTENKNIQNKMVQQRVKFNKKVNVKHRKFKWRHFKSPQVRRIFQLLSATIEYNDTSKFERLVNISSHITEVYNNGRPCYGKCLGTGEVGIVDLFSSERDYDQLAGFWSSWRNQTGRKVKELFVERMNLENLLSREKGFSDAASYLVEQEFEEKNFNETVQRLYNEILPFYQQLHGYVRYCLSKFYPKRFDERGPIPAHILGNVWAQQWNNILPIIQQCQGNVSNIDIQDEVNQQLRHLSIKDMFKLAEEFYTSMGLYPMSDNFWERSVLKEQRRKLMDCHPSAHDFSNGVDFRIKICTKRNINDFTIIHHEMGHIEYFMAYQHLPSVLQGSANPGFHEAIGDTIALAVKTPEHLKTIGLISKVPTSKDFDINYLLTAALEKVAFIPFAMTVQHYNSDVYSGSVPYGRLNQHWWELRYRFQGLKPPIPRSEDDFDPGAKYHIALGISYIRYFASFIYQYQFYESMCKLSGYEGQLHRCDFYQSKAAGRKLYEVLSKGRSEMWRDTLEILTDGKDINSKSLLTFFDPLYEWLKETNDRLKIPVGW